MKCAICGDAIGEMSPEELAKDETQNRLEAYEELCNSCWEVMARLDRFLNHRSAVAIVLRKLAAKMSVPGEFPR